MAYANTNFVFYLTFRNMYIIAYRSVKHDEVPPLPEFHRAVVCFFVYIASEFAFFNSAFLEVLFSKIRNFALNIFHSF